LESAHRTDGLVVRARIVEVSEWPSKDGIGSGIVIGLRNVSVIELISLSRIFVVMGFTLYGGVHGLARFQ
jgi:hypothetical protein